MRIYFVFFLLLCPLMPLLAQRDTLQILDEVVVTATRQERRLGNVAIPVQLIQRKQIQQAGSMRLRDILQEQPGLQLVTGFGAGLQMQGLSPEHTLILLDGQPLIGRTSGVLDLSRVSLSGIKRIEIIKGPSSSLYGSEAMAGVINLITDNGVKPQAEISLRYGVADTKRGWGIPFSSQNLEHTEADAQFSFRVGKWNVKQSNNYLYADAISYRPFSQDRVPRPLSRFASQSVVQGLIGKKIDLRVLTRLSQDLFRQQFSVQNNGVTTASFGRERNNEVVFQPALTYRHSASLTISTKAYIAKYTGDQELRFSAPGDSIYKDRFEQRLYRLENQFDIKKGSTSIVAGLGVQLEQANSTRYDDFSNKKENSVRYAFAQWEVKLGHKWISVLGARFDHHTIYSAALTPKWALRYQPNARLSFKGSIGQGFKAPDFRQLFLNFTNTAAGGYSVFGAAQAIDVINSLNQLGQIAERKPDFLKLSALRPEFSTGANVEINYSFTVPITTQLSLFRNDINSLIDVRHVATRLDGSQLFSYLNVNRAFTQGIELGVRWQLYKSLSLNLGYQYLETADKEERSRIDQGKEYIRDVSGAIRLMNTNEYAGLPNRSKHQAQLKLTYEPAIDRFVNLRLFYRSRWTIANSNGNTVYDHYDEFANGFLQVNLSGGFSINSHLVFQAGIDNLLNYQDIFYQPNLQPRTVFVLVRLKMPANRTSTIQQSKI
jgi:outer membrane receptor for ferrienterochelin and colicins